MSRHRRRLAPMPVGRVLAERRCAEFKIPLAEMRALRCFRLESGHEAHEIGLGKLLACQFAGHTAFP